MEKTVVFMQKTIDGKLYTTYHVIPKIDDERLRQEVMKATINAFPTFEEADALAKEG